MSRFQHWGLCRSGRLRRELQWRSSPGRTGHSDPSSQENDGWELAEAQSPRAQELSTALSTCTLMAARLFPPEATARPNLGRCISRPVNSASRCETS